MFVYTFHMPAFIIISGYFSRSFTARPDQLKRLLTGVAVPYVVFEVAYSLFKRWADDDPDHAVQPARPALSDLVPGRAVRLAADDAAVELVRWPLPVALALAALGPLTPGIGRDLDLQRVLQFLPFFVLGLWLKPEHFQMVRRREVRLLALPVFAGAALFAYWAAPRMSVGWFYHPDSAQELGAPWWIGRPS